MKKAIPIITLAVLFAVCAAVSYFFPNWLIDAICLLLLVMLLVLIGGKIDKDDDEF